MVKMLLIRHGETDYTLTGRYCGFSNPSLNRKGIQQSERLAIRLKEAGVDKIYSSDLKRAYESAKIIFKNNSIEKIADFREMNFGLFEELKYEEIIKVYPKLYREWIDNPMRVKIPGGEGLVELEKRVKEGLSFISSQNAGKTIALVSHGGPIRIILCQALKLGLESFWKVEQEIGTLRIIDYPKGALA
ncbi:MAG: histidine phosphatase family protein [Candidatus Omnitrophica bacterium]|nr:histidine phosphatase family protein [Candidatus Omnitrophota bacterium]